MFLLVELEAGWLTRSEHPPQSGKRGQYSNAKNMFPRFALVYLRAEGNLKRFVLLLVPSLLGLILMHAKIRRLAGALCWLFATLCVSGRDVGFGL
ncbi:hypothetical protein FMZ60_08340 [Alcaligenaceae bacterium SJ-26]|nr:hypothetical protein FMZ60_08340 [Alcaligenaceae bacterium SJ-26]